MKQYFIWELDGKTNVPRRILKTEDKESFIDRIVFLLEEEAKFSCRVEDVK